MHSRKEIRSLTPEQLLALRRAMAELQRLLQGNSEIPEVDAASATARFAHDFGQIPINTRGTDAPPDHRNWPFYLALRVPHRSIRRNPPKRITAI